MEELYIVAARRSPVGNFQGELASLPATALASQVITAMLGDRGIGAEAVDEVIMGQVLTAGCGQNTARQASINAGIGTDTPAMTINKVCGSGLKAVHLAAQAILAGDAQMVVAGGMESMSQAPHLLPGSRQGVKMGTWEAVDSMLNDGLTDAFNDYHMGITAENLAEHYDIDREAQDAFAVESQRRATAAIDQGLFDAQLVPIEIPQRKGKPQRITRDQGPRADTSLEGLAALRPAFRKDGTVTAGNASGINDGAAAVVVCSRSAAERLGLEPMVRLRAWGNAAVDPSIMGIGPVSATQRCLQRAGWQTSDLELIEANEAFAAQALAVNREMGWDPARVNVNGGAIALGHPIGASGCRILVTLIHEMLRRDAATGLATLCIGGGQGVALAVER